MRTENQEKWILYSTSDEDAQSELRALKVTPNDSVLSVTGSGCRTLSLLSRNPRRLVSVDYAPGQNYLLELKLAAIRTLSYDQLLAFFGVEPCTNRWTIFEKLRHQLSAEAAAYFGRHRPAIEKGVLFAGRHEQFYVKFVAPMMHLFFGRALRRIYRCDSIDEQRRIYKGEIDNRLWRWLIRKGFSEKSLRKVFNDQNYKFEIDVPSSSEYMLQRLEHTFSHHLAKNNHWLSFMLNGKYTGRDSLPHFLMYESCQAIRRATTAVEIVTANLGEYVKELPGESFDKFALSDVSSCITRSEFNALLAEVARISRSGGRICYRNFLSKFALSDGLQRDDALCESLDNDDLAFVYSFEVATVAGQREPGLSAAVKAISA